MPAVTDRAIDVALEKGLFDLVKYMVIHNKPSMMVDFEGVTYEVTPRYIRDLRAREYQHLLKNAKGSRKSKDVSSEQRCKITESVEHKVDYALQHTNGFKVSPKLREAVLSNVRCSLTSRKACPKRTTYIPRLLFYIDDHFAEFLKGINLGLLSKNFEGTGSATLTRELGQMESSFLGFLRDHQVGASTVLNALVVFYTNTHDLRVKSGKYNSYIKMNDHLRKFVNSPIDSAFRGKSLADKYEASSTTKKTGDREVESLTSYRKSNPKKSVTDYLLATSSKEDQAVIRDGYLMGKHIMSLVSAHLIPAASFSEADKKALSMDTDKDEQYVNPNVNTLIALQAVISSTQKTDEVRPAMVKARSPTRSPSRSPSRGRNTAARSPTRSPSRSPRVSRVRQ